MRGAVIVASSPGKVYSQLFNFSTGNIEKLNHLGISLGLLMWEEGGYIQGYETINILLPFLLTTCKLHVYTSFHC